MGIQPIRKVVAPEIPDKLYFRIGDVARICEVPAYVLRFWETEFPQLKPNKGGTGQRLYRRRDVEMALRIKSLLYDMRYTIPGARQVFKDEAKAREVANAEASIPVPAARESFAPETEQNAQIQPKISSMAAKSQVTTSVPDAGLDLRRQTQLSALREDMRSLLAMLGGNDASSTLATAARPMRPRLVLEPRTSLARAEALRPEMLRLVRTPDGPRDLNQGDLFQAE